MKAIFSSLLVILFSGASVFAQTVINDPNVQTRNVDGFTRISVGGSFDVYINQSDNFGVAVSAKSADDVNRIKTEVKNGTLYIKYESVAWTKGGTPLKAYISAPVIQRIDASGACDVSTKGILAGEDMEIWLSGASDFTGALAVTNLKIDASGASDFRLQGKAENFKVQVSGSSDVKAFTLITEFCEADISGASDLQVTVNKELKVRGSGASEIQYKGEGTIREAKLSGSSDIKKKD